MIISLPQQHELTAFPGSQAVSTVTTNAKTGVVNRLPPIPINPLKFPRGPTTQEMQLTGACDWYKISKLVHAENHLIDELKKNGLTEQAWKLEQSRDDLLAHRMANSPFESAKSFLRNNCANDLYIAKWRHDIDSFSRGLKKAVISERIPPDRSIELRYQSQLLRHQAKASLPYTGYYNSVPKPPSIKPGTFGDLPYEPKYKLTQAGFSTWSIPTIIHISNFL